MLDEEEYASDTSDEDYVPGGEGEAVSEDEISGEEENLDTLDDDPDSASKGKCKRKKSAKKTVTSLARKRKGGIKLDDEDDQVETPATDTYSKELQESMKAEAEAKKADEEKKKADDLWAMFKSDTTPSRPKPKAAVGSGLGSLTSTIKSPVGNKPGVKTSSPAKPCPAGNITAGAASKITITKEYDFAGETVKITKQVDVDSKEAKQELKKQTEGEKDELPSPKVGASTPSLKRPGGLGNVLGMIGKKQKLSTLEKSKLDWENFKQEEGISEELAIHNRGKAGYIERKAFLERTDMRQFEIEKSIRLSNSKR